MRNEYIKWLIDFLIVGVLFFSAILFIMVICYLYEKSHYERFEKSTWNDEAYQYCIIKNKETYKALVQFNRYDIYKMRAIISTPDNKQYIANLLYNSKTGNIAYVASLENKKILFFQPEFLKIRHSPTVSGTCSVWELFEKGEVYDKTGTLKVKVEQGKSIIH